jgi:hypothetical protein
MERLGDDVRRELAARGAPGDGSLDRIVEAWPTAVGAAIARAAWPARLARDGTLHVATASSTWAFELGRLAGEIAARLGATLGEEAPSALRFAPGRIPEPPAQVGDGTGPQEPRPSAEERSSADRIAAGIDDADLRALVARAAAASLARGRDDRGIW